jgi:hypothetical protein
LTARESNVSDIKAVIPLPTEPEDPLDLRKCAPLAWSVWGPACFPTGRLSLVAGLPSV